MPELVRIYKDRGIVHWNAYAMVAIIELQRTENGNPKIPSWLEEDYFAAVQELAVIGGHELCQTSDPEVIVAMLGLVAVARGLRVFGKVLSCYSEQEVKDMLANL